MQITLLPRLGLVSLIICSEVVTGLIDPTDLGSWPPCAQRCIPQGFTGAANCGSLSNLDCVCTKPDFTLAIADCEQNTCTILEKDEIQKLSDVLCAPVGGVGTAVSSAAAGFFATYTKTQGLPPTPIVVAPTPAPNLGNTSDLNDYPPCDQKCAYQARAAITSCNTKDKACICSPEFRGMTAGCVEYNCNTGEERATDDRDDQFCGPLYVNNASLSASVAAAITSGTRSAQSVISASASAIIAAQNGTNGSITASTGTPTPEAFTSGAGTVSDWVFCVALVMVTSSTGALALGL